MACEKHGYNNPTMCPACDLEDARLAAAECRGDEAGFRRGLEAAAKIVHERIANGTVGHVALGPQATYETVATHVLNVAGKAAVEAIRAIPYTPPGEEA